MHDGLSEVKRRGDPEAILSIWRTEVIKGPEVSSLQKPIGDWPDQISREAEERVRGLGADIPWGYGQKFGERDFRVTGLRAGGIGVVLLVESDTPEGKRFYAAKTLLPFLKPEYLKKSLQEQERISQAFLEEALPWLEMGQHPHIVPVLLLEKVVHLGLNRSIPFIFSLFMPRGSLKEYLAQRGRLSLRESLALGIQLCDGLVHAYGHGLDAHLDLKPENIMVHDDGVFRITDFSSGVIGTPGYMAPEQVPALWQKRGTGFVTNDISMDHRADQFALGIVLLEALNGEHPFPICFDACGSMGWAREYLDKGVGSLKDNSSIPEGLKKILSRILSLAPDDRFPDMSVLKAELLDLYEREFERYKAPGVELDYSANWCFERGMAFYTLGRYASAEEPFNEALFVFRSMPGTELEQAICKVSLGTVLGLIGRFEEAVSLYEDALIIYRSIPGTELKQAACIIHLGLIYSDTGHFEEAISAYEEALSIFRSIPGTEFEQAKCMGNLGNVYQKIGLFEDAMSIYREVLSIYRLLPGTEFDQAICTMNFGTSCSQAGHFEEAMSAYEEALGIFRSIPGTEFYQAICTMEFGLVYLGSGHYEESLPYLEEALSIYQSIPGTELKQANCMKNIGDAFDRTGRFEEAMSYLEGAFSIYSLIPGTEINQAKCIMSLGNVYSNIGHFDEAISKYEEALDIYSSIPGTELNQAHCTVNLGNVYLDMDCPEEAISAFEEAFSIYSSIPGTELYRATCKKKLGDAYWQTDQFDNAYSANLYAINIYSSIPGKEHDLAICIANLGNVYADLGYIEEARSAYEKALGMFCSISDTELEQAQCMCSLAVIYYQEIEDPDKAFRYAVYALKLCEPFPPEKTAKIREVCKTVLERLGLI